LNLEEIHAFKQLVIPAQAAIWLNLEEIHAFKQLVIPAQAGIW